MFSKRAAPTPFDRVIAQPGAAKEREVNESSFLNRVIQPMGDRLVAQPTALTKGINLDDVRARLMKGGFPRGLRAQDFLVLKFILLATLGFVFMLIAPVYGELLGLSIPFLPMVGLIFGAICGWKLPDIWLASITTKRQTDIRLFLPDMIDLVTVSVEAGLGLDASLQRVASRFPNALSEEVMRAMQEVQLGRSRMEALRDMARRTDVPDLTAWVTALVQAELLGVSIANVLRVQSERLREKRAQRAREQAQKAPIKMVFPLVLFIFPALFIIILGPVALIVMQSGF
ncbi:MAG TPA: type II secretion system F family protein [Abditibacteriaceae bacterium]|jgi:tight adherence protein C